MRALYIMLAVGMTALLSSVVLSGPVYADQISDNTFALLGAAAGQHSPEIMLVKRGGVSFYGGIGSYGFGYGMSGDDIPADFIDSTYFRPFPDRTAAESPATIMTNINVGKNRISTLAFKVNISPIQSAGSYQTVINFVATPSF